MLWEECQHVWGGGVGINMPWEGGINMSWGGGGGRGLTCLGKGVHALGGGGGGIT